jgi:hypothetical protein
MAEYLKTEERYVSSAMHFARSAAVSELLPRDLERIGGCTAVAENVPIDIGVLPDVIRHILRESFWCKLERRPDFYIHFGYDYYMYIGSQRELSESVAFARNQGLFVEELVSPFLDWC